MAIRQGCGWKSPCSQAAFAIPEHIAQAAVAAIEPRQGRSKMKNWRFSSLLAPGIMAGLAGTALAQPTVNGTFYEEQLGIGCSLEICTLEFTALTSRVLFSKVSCGAIDVASTSNLRLVEFSVRDMPGSVPRRTELLPFGPPGVSTLSNALKTYSLTAPVDFLFAPGKIPTIRFFFYGPAGNNNGVTCKITGRVQT